MDYQQKIRSDFENANESRAWFVSAGRVDYDVEEGFVYDDFTTDMCWTCWFEACNFYKSNSPQGEEE